MNWRQIRSDFVKWIQSKNYDREYTKRIVSELDKRVAAFTGPLDVSCVFTGLTPGQAHNLNRAVRAFFRFYEEIAGVDERELSVYRKAIPKDEIGFDVRIPNEKRIINSLQQLTNADPKYRAVYEQILDSGLRLREAVRLINLFGQNDVEKLRNFCVAPLGFFRKTKLSYFAFFTKGTMDLIKVAGATNMTAGNVSGYFGKRRGLVDCKYLRKFAFDTMIDLGIPESVADFIQGRTPKTEGSRHYMVLVRQAKKFYPRYARYIVKLREKALN
jgi:intergrase/recombinase